MANPGMQALEHVVVLMLENRSFDHLLGTLPHVNGVLDPEGAVRTDLVNHVDPDDASSTAYHPKLGAHFSNPAIREVTKNAYEGPSHSFPAATMQLFGTETVGSGKSETTPYTAPPKTPHRPCGFVKNFVGELTRAYERGGTTLAEQQEAASKAGTEDPVQEVMEVFTAEQLPAIHTLAREFCCCDRWHSEIPGPTEPNRLFMHAATSTGLTFNPWAYDELDVPTIYDRLEEVGKSWAMYGFDLFDSSNFDGIKNAPTAKLPMSQFWSDAKQGALPFYTFLCPRYADVEAGMANSQHAPHDVRFGDQLIADVYETLRNGPKWHNTLLVVLYDEHGGFYDHVTPPAAPPPDGDVSPNAFMQEESRKYEKTYLTAPNYSFGFTSLGFRVPAILVSPWIQRGVVDSTLYQHTSILKFVSQMLGTQPLTARDAGANDFVANLSLPEPRDDCPTTLPTPKLPETDAELVLATAPSPKQKEVTRRYTSKLEGHPDTGHRIAGDFETNLSLASYIEQRKQFDEWYRAGDWKKASFEVYRDSEDGWRFHLRDADGGLVAASTHSYSSKKEAELALRRLQFLSYVLQRSPEPAQG